MSMAAIGTRVCVQRFGARRWCRLLLIVAATMWVVVQPDPARAIEEAQAAQGPPLNIALFVSSRGDLCYDTGEVAAVRRLATEEQERINRRGGVAGRPVNVRIFDDERDEGRAIANMRAALADRNLLGMVGLTHSGRAKAVFSALGDDIRVSGAPFLSEISVSGIFAGHPNVFTTRASQDEERVPVMAAFTRALGFSRPAFLGTAGSVMSDAMRESLKNLLGDNGLAADQRISVVDGKPDAASLAAAVAELASRKPDMIYLSVGSRANPDVVAALTAAGVTPALFVTGRIDTLPPAMTAAYPSPLYQLAWENLPDVYNSRLRKLVVQAPSNPWIFEGAKNGRAPGWTSGECKVRDEIRGQRDPFDAANMRAIAIGARYADMVALIAGALRGARRGTEIEVLRSQAVAETTAAFAMGRGAFKGTFENWSFDPSTRTASRTPFVVILPRGLGRLQLAPVQFRRARDGGLRQIKTLYMDIDLIKAHRVDDNEKTFFAEFYLAMHDDPAADIDNVDFVNAFLDPRTHGRQISIETLHGGGNSGGIFPASMKIYKVVGRFLFDPRLANYPFDTQSFAIEVQPKRGDASFIVQPPPAEIRDKRVATESWEPVTHYVGYDEDFVPVVDSFTHEASVAPFYKASFVWTMRRETTDYFLRVVVPLVFILIIAYLSIFIPGAHFEAIVTIQVTALLSAVALYISLPKLDSDVATLSDRIFVFDYMLVSIMIAISILRINPLIASHRWMRGALEFVHVAIVPALVVVAAYFVYGMSVAAG
jgi:ABC-type branched-subunit amino acid transport system substrate-binding protein